MPQDTGYINLHGKLARKFMREHEMNEKVSGTFAGKITRMEARQELGGVFTGAKEKKAKPEEYCCVEISLTALDNPGKLGKAKAKEMLSHGEVHGKALTKKQKGYFGAVAGGNNRY